MEEVIFLFFFLTYGKAAGKYGKNEKKRKGRAAIGDWTFYRDEILIPKKRTDS